MEGWEASGGEKMNSSRCMLLKTRAKVLAMENAARLGGVKVFRGVTSARRLFEYPALELPLLSVSRSRGIQCSHSNKLTTLRVVFIDLWQTKGHVGGFGGPDLAGRTNSPKGRRLFGDVAGG